MRRINKYRPLLLLTTSYLLLVSGGLLLSGTLAFADPTTDATSIGDTGPSLVAPTNSARETLGPEAPAVPLPTTGGYGFHLTPDCNATLPPNPAAAAEQVQKLRSATPTQWKEGDLENPCNVQAFVDWVKKIINYLFIISIPIAAGFIVYGAFVMITSGGSPEGFSKGKKVILSAIIGIVIILTSNIIVTTVQAILKAATS